MDFEELFKKPCIIGVVANVNEGKSMLLHHIYEELNKKNTFHLVTYGFKTEIPCLKIYSLEELEQIKDSVILLDEVMSLFDLDNRKLKKQIENTLRLIHHNNNILVLCMLPENVKKFISGKINHWIFKKCTLEDFIQGSKGKQIVTGYRGIELGSSILNLPINEALLFSGHYHKIRIPYYPKYDTKADNKPILTKKDVREFVRDVVRKDVRDCVPKKDKNTDKIVCETKDEKKNEREVKEVKDGRV